MPPWLEHVLSALSPEGAIVTALGTLLAVLRAVGAILEARKTRAFRRAEASIPPIACTVDDDRAAEISALRAAQHRELWVREEKIRALNEELRVVGEDHGRTARALSQTQLELERTQARVRELEEKQRAIDGGHTHLPPAPRTAGSRPSWEAVHVEEVDDQVTPAQGHRRPR
jgi:septal ring factor EnvC (AmiA/AmiB activator)